MLNFAQNAEVIFQQKKRMGFLAVNVTTTIVVAISTSVTRVVFVRKNGASAVALKAKFLTSCGKPTLTKFSVLLSYYVFDEKDTKQVPY